jgi:hypothetical protein
MIATPPTINRTPNPAITRAMPTVSARAAATSTGTAVTPLITM